jgi:hypothetical protein
MELPTFKERVEEHLRHYRLAVADLPILNYSEYQVAVSQLTETFAEKIEQDAGKEVE